MIKSSYCKENSRKALRKTLNVDHYSKFKKEAEKIEKLFLFHNLVLEGLLERLDNL